MNKIDFVSRISAWHVSEIFATYDEKIISRVAWLPRVRTFRGRRFKTLNSSLKEMTPGNYFNLFLDISSERLNSFIPLSADCWLVLLVLLSAEYRHRGRSTLLPLCVVISTMCPSHSSASLEVEDHFLHSKFQNTKLFRTVFFILNSTNIRTPRKLIATGA